MIRFSSEPPIAKPIFHIEKKWTSNSVGKMISTDKKTLTGFVADDSYMATIIEVVSLSRGNIGNIADPRGRIMYIVLLSVGRGRRNQYIITDGKGYEIVAGTKRDNRRRDWTTQNGPWRIVKRSTAKRYTITCQKAVKAAITAWQAENLKAKT